mmetsp:Transcript_50208/g.83606  ORF Transcript_50208/g.83606 Transcript_50208/m.83606 type:complete len:235 (-) Transcript_50208:134-838(-)
MSYTATPSAQQRRNAMMERMLINKLNQMKQEYETMKSAERRLRRKHATQAKKDQQNPNFDPNVLIEYNPNFVDNKSSDDDDDDDNDNATEQQTQSSINSAADEDRIHLSDDGVDKIKAIMNDMPSLNHVPTWAETVPMDVWKTSLLNKIPSKASQTNEECKTEQTVPSTQTQTKSQSETESQSTGKMAQHSDHQSNDNDKNKVKAKAKQKHGHGHKNKKTKNGSKQNKKKKSKK